MHTDQQFDSYPVEHPRFGTKQMSAEMIRRSQEQIAASIALLQSQAPKVLHPQPEFKCREVSYLNVGTLGRL